MLSRERASRGDVGQPTMPRINPSLLAVPRIYKPWSSQGEGLGNTRSKLTLYMATKTGKNVY